MAGIALVQALVRELAIQPGLIGLVKRADPLFAFVITVPPGGDVQSLVEIMGTSTTFQVASIYVVALPGTATETTTMLYVYLRNPAWDLEELEDPTMQVNITEKDFRDPARSSGAPSTPSSSPTSRRCTARPRLATWMAHPCWATR